MPPWYLYIFWICSGAATRGVLGVLRNFRKLIGKHPCLSLFFNKIAGLRRATLLKRLWHRCFSANFAKFLKTPFFMEHLWWLLLNFRALKYRFWTESDFLKNWLKIKSADKFRFALLYFRKHLIIHWHCLF